ncbi:MAG: ADP-ribosylglycohydrolase family protein [Chloroflexota bacterium]|nr:ADP-ribosylglycohydrolase family protein [Chloroflexota bacterium]
MTLPTDYVERVYAGVLGKIIAVYLGRPIEGWSYEMIIERFGEINYYVHEALDLPLIVTDDDLSGTFTFARAMPDYGNSPDLTPAQIGQTWLNYIVEGKTILWWGGIGDVTEHTAYIRLKNGIQPPRSGSIELNGPVMAQQIGSQIFIDSWGMIAPGDPALAADLARRAACVSHDGEAIYGAQVVAALVAQAFVESDINKLIDAAVSLIPPDSITYRMIEQVRNWQARQPDWRGTLGQIDSEYNRDRYPGNCHIVPNHARIILALLYGDDDFQKSLMVVNTSGFDTDCNSGNVGCIMGVKNGLAGIDAGPDWRGPVADRLYLPSADGGSGISDAVGETYKLVNIGRGMRGLAPLAPKNGARYHFSLPGSVQGFESETGRECKNTLTIENVTGRGKNGDRSLALRFHQLAKGRIARAATLTFIPSKEIADYFDERGYRLLASPTLYPGQEVRAGLAAGASNAEPVSLRLYARHYNEDDALEIIGGESVQLAPGAEVKLSWRVPETGNQPLATVGIEIAGEDGASGVVYLDWLTWDGAPNMQLSRPQISEAGREKRKRPKFWKKAWIYALDSSERFDSWDYWPQAYRLIQNQGRGLLIQGTRDWIDYQFAATAMPRVCEAGGIAVRVQGLQRYYALLLDQESTRIVRVLDGETVLAQSDTGWSVERNYELKLKVEGAKLTAFVNGEQALEAIDPDNALTGGGIALIAQAGFIYFDKVAVKPL